MKFYIISLINKSLVWIALLSLVSCNSLLRPDAPVSLQDRTLITGQPCQAPCWYGLQPGVSSQEDILEISESLAFVDSDSAKILPAGYGEIGTDEIDDAIHITYKCVSPSNQVCVEFTLVGDILKRIITHPNYDLTFGELTSFIGEPEYVSSLVSGEDVSCLIELIWPQSQIVAIAAENEYDSGVALCENVSAGRPLDRTLLVRSIAYFSPTWFHSVPRDGMDIPWPGFN